MLFRNLQKLIYLRISTAPDPEKRKILPAIFRPMVSRPANEYARICSVLSADATDSTMSSFDRCIQGTMLNADMA